MPSPVSEADADARVAELARPVQITQKRVAWPESEIAAYLASRKRSGGEA